MAEVRRAESAVVPSNPTQLHAWRERSLPDPEQIRPYVWSVAIPFDLTPIRFTYCYVIAAEGGAIVIDPGWDTEAGWNALVKVLEQASGESDGSLAQGIIITHFHPDHLAMARRLRDATGAWVGIQTNDEFLLRQLGAEPKLTTRRDWMASFGIPEAARPKLVISARMMSMRPTADDITRVLQGGETFETLAGPLVTIHTPGHTAGHLSLVLEEEGLLFTGDHILPRITPSLEFRWDRRGNPLSDYYRSLNACAALGELEVAPAHEYRFTGLAARVQELIDHHLLRSTEIAAAYWPGRTVWDVATTITWSRPWSTLDAFNVMLALTETECHLVDLSVNGRISWRPQHEILVEEHP